MQISHKASVANYCLTERHFQLLLQLLLKTNHVFSSTPDKDNLFLQNPLEEKRSLLVGTKKVDESGHFFS